MSAFIYEGKLPLTGISVHRLDDTDGMKNAFQVAGPLIERIVAVCQGPNEANKWVDLLLFHSGASSGGAMQTSTATVRRMTADGGGLGNSRQVSSASSSSAAVNIPHPPPHVSKLIW